MAKRTATTELTHDNWDKEDESEEAGTFQRASETEMKGRVIRKAKRRNLTEDGKKNVFAGLTFTGQKSENAFSFLSSKESNGSAVSTDAFSFLKKDENKENGSMTSSTTTSSSFGSFVFGGGAKAVSSNPAPAFGGFVFGSPKAEDRLKENGEKEKLATLKAPENGTEPKEESSKLEVEVKFTKSDSEKEKSTEKSKEDQPEGKPDDLFAKFMKPKGTSESSPAEPASAAEKSKVEQPESKPDDLFAKFMKPKSGGTWSCDICMLSNKADVLKCVACENPKPGAGPAPAASTPAETQQQSFSFGASGGFKFNTSTETPPASSGGFNFDASATAAQATSGGFKFNASTEDAPATTGGFKFNASTEDAPATTGSFKFNASTEAAPATSGGFKFGSSSKTPEKSESTPATSRGFTFNTSTEAAPATSGGFKFGSSSESPKESSSKVSGFDIGQIKPASPKGGFKFGQTEETATPKGFRYITSGFFGEPSGPFGTPTGAKSAIPAVLEGTPTSAASNRSKYLGNLKALNLQVSEWITKHVDKNQLIDLTPIFDDYKLHMTALKSQYGVKPKADKVEEPVSGKPAEEEEMTEDSEAPQEEGAHFSQKCKLFYRKDGKYVEKGKGMLFLKKSEEKNQLIIRQETVTGLILLNVMVESQGALDRVGNKDVLLVCVPNPAMLGEQPGPVTFLIRVKNSETADELFNHLSDTQ